MVIQNLPNLDFAVYAKFLCYAYLQFTVVNCKHAQVQVKISGTNFSGLM